MILRATLALGLLVGACGAPENSHEVEIESSPDPTVLALVNATKNERFAWDCYRRFIQQRYVCLSMRRMPPVYE